MATTTIIIPNAKDFIGTEPLFGGDAGGKWYVMVFDFHSWTWKVWTYFTRKRSAESWCRGKFASMDFVRILRMED